MPYSLAYSVFKQLLFILRYAKIYKIFFYLKRRSELEKIVVKTAVKTVLVILGVIAVVFAIFNFAFPQHMATVTESLGNYSLAVKYASLRYSYTKNGDDLARCFDDAVLLGEDKYILQYGEELVSRKDFETICQKRNDKMGGGYNYENRIKGKIAVSYYNTGKKEEAVELAATANGTQSFAYGNALMSLSAVVRSQKDGETASLILQKLEFITPTSEEDARYLMEVRSGLKNVKQ